MQTLVCKDMADIGHDPSVHDITYENTQARERTQILFDLANKENCLLVGTGDLSELAMGWCTYNGDHMSMYGVNASVPKTLVRYLVDYVAGELGGRTEEILRDVLDTPVSPELRLRTPMARSPKKRRRRSAPMNCMTFSSITLCASALTGKSWPCWRRKPLTGSTIAPPLTGG